MNKLTLPLLTLQLHKSVDITGVFNTGSSVTLISYEWLIEQGLIDSGRFPTMLMLGDEELMGFYVKLTAQVVVNSKESNAKEINVFAINNFKDTKVSNLWSAGYPAIFGRDIIVQLGASVEIDIESNTTKLLQKTWSEFESDVADNFRALGLQVKTNYNLSGNQVDVFLTENTRSGKPLRTVVECKYHKKPVGVQIARNFSNLIEFARLNKLAEHGILVSSSGFTKDAHLIASTTEIELLDYSELVHRARDKDASQTSETNNTNEINSSKSNSDNIIVPKTAFVIMPFSESFRDTYLLGISAALGEKGYVCRRVDEIEFSGRVLNEIQDNIHNSEVIIAELSEPNPNVYYELGIAHTLGKYVVLCTKNATDIPFDLRDMNHIVYKDIVELKSQLLNHIDSIISPNVAN